MNRNKIFVRDWSLLFITIFLWPTFCAVEGNPLQPQITGRTATAVLVGDDRVENLLTLLDRVGISLGLGKTILAPTDQAIDQWFDEDPEIALLYTNRSEYAIHLAEILSWHVITEDAFTVGQIFDGSRIQIDNLKGSMTIDQTSQKIENVARTEIVAADIPTTSTTGESVIVHVLDDIVIPPYLNFNMIEVLLNPRQDTVFAYSTMANLALFARLDDEINQLYEGGLTLLVPPNRRFNRAQVDVVELTSPSSFNYTRDFVLAHLINGTYGEARTFAEQQANGVEEVLLKSALGTSLWITTSSDRLRFQSVEVLLPDQPVRNGIFHVMDGPLFPPILSDFAEFTAGSTSYDTSGCFRFFRETLLSSKDISEIAGSNLTLFCPTQTAFDSFNNEIYNRLLEPKWVRHAEEFLLNHITVPAMTREDLLEKVLSNITMLNGEVYQLRRSGDKPRIRATSLNQARVDFGDIFALDGFLHILDSPIAPTATTQGVYERSLNNPDFSLLVESIDFVQLGDQINTDIPITMLAPDNAAFRRVSFPATEVGDIIKRHLFFDLNFCDDIATKTQIEALSGDVLDVELRGEPGSGLWGPEGQNLYVGGAYIYNCDVFAANGVVHYIDRVIGIDYNTDAPSISEVPTLSPFPTLNDTESSMQPSNSPSQTPLIMVENFLSQTLFGISSLSEIDIENWEELATVYANAFIASFPPPMGIFDFEAVLLVQNVTVDDTGMNETDGDVGSIEIRRRNLQNSDSDAAIVVEYSHTLSYRQNDADVELDVAKYVLDPFNSPPRKAEFLELLLDSGGGSLSDILSISDVTPENEIPRLPTPSPTPAPTPMPTAAPTSSASIYSPMSVIYIVAGLLIQIAVHS